MRPTIVFLFAVLGVLSFQGCSSEEGPQNKVNPQDKCPVSPQYCPAMGVGKACCLADKCGVDHGTGCIPTTTDAGA